jgi:formamidopyrimidine-DNA glycosylase
MPEGDTIRGVANALALLVGQTIERATTQGLVRALAGRTVTHVDAHGKHLFIDLDDQTQLHVHQGMNGRFRAMSRSDGDVQLARMSPGRASLAIVTRVPVGHVSDRRDRAAPCAAPRDVGDRAGA